MLSLLAGTVKRHRVWQCHCFMSVEEQKSDQAGGHGDWRSVRQASRKKSTSKSEERHHGSKGKKESSVVEYRSVRKCPTHHERWVAELEKELHEQIKPNCGHYKRAKDQACFCVTFSQRLQKAKDEY